MPAFVTVETCDEDGHGFVCASGLDLLVGAAPRLAFGAAVLVCGRLDGEVGERMVLLAFFLDERSPEFGRHLLRTHEPHSAGRQVATEDASAESGAGGGMVHVPAHGAPLLYIEHDKCRVLPFLDNVLLVGLDDAAVINAALDIFGQRLHADGGGGGGGGGRH